MSDKAFRHNKLIGLALLVGMTPAVWTIGNVGAGDDGGADPVNLPALLSNGKSLNWSGYAVQTSFPLPLPGSVSDVRGDWKVPAVSCAGSGNSYSAAWVGIDGYAGATVEQVGTRQDCISGAPAYSAFYEMFPLPPVVIPVAIRGGDQVSAGVTATSLSTFQLQLTNTTTGAAFSTNQTGLLALRQSAEWIMERSAVNGSGVLLPVSNFGSVAFRNLSVTVNGRVGDVNDFGWQYKQIDLAGAGGNTLADATGLQASGDRFKVNWLSAQ
jgi:hypothetical protein